MFVSSSRARTCPSFTFIPSSMSTSATLPVTLDGNRRLPPRRHVTRGIQHRAFAAAPARFPGDRCLHRYGRCLRPPKKSRAQQEQYHRYQNGGPFGRLRLGRWFALNAQPFNQRLRRAHKSQRERTRPGRSGRSGSGVAAGMLQGSMILGFSAWPLARDQRGPSL